MKKYLLLLLGTLCFLVGYSQIKSRAKNGADTINCNRDFIPNIVCKIVKGKGTIQFDWWRDCLKFVKTYKNYKEVFGDTIVYDYDAEGHITLVFPSKYLGEVFYHAKNMAGIRIEGEIYIAKNFLEL